MGEKPQLLIQEVLQGLGRLNALVKKIMDQTGAPDPNEAIRRINSGEWIVVPREQSAFKFNPAVFIGEGWSFSDKDRLPLAPADIDPEAVEFIEVVLKKGEVSIKGWERDERLRKADRVHLGPDHFLAYWEMCDKLSESWKIIGFITFDAVKLRDPDGNRYTLYLCWVGGAWHWYCHWLGGAFNSQYQSAVAGK